MNQNRKKQISIVLCTAALSGNLLVTAYGGQAYVNDTLVSHTITKDSRIYVPLSEVSRLLGADVTYDPESNTAFVTQTNRPAEDNKGTVRHADLYPVSVERYDTPSGREIVKRYELTSGQNPANIPREDFTENGYTYKLSDITKDSLITREEKDATETLTIATQSKEINEVIKEIPAEKEFTTADGYTGVLKLDVNSIQTNASGYRNYSYTLTDTREYPNLASTDTSQIPKTIQKNGKTLSLASVEWKSANQENIDYLDVANVYTAIATYSAAATGSSVTGYQTTAQYTGTVERTDNKGTVYTARFTGVVFSVAQAKELVEEARVYEKLAAQAQKAGVTVDELLSGENADKIREAASSPSLLPLLLLPLAAAAAAAFFLLKKNVTVYAIGDDGNYDKIGKVKLSKKKPIINLGDFNDQVTNPDFLLVIDKFTAWRLRDVDVTLHRGGITMQHTIKPEQGKKYQFDVKY